MACYGFKMRLKDEQFIAQYDQLHTAVNAKVFEAHSWGGIRNYSIFR